ncbi:MAG: hypothetical protein RLY70_2350 [Planctomycetota bacterium]|jgi:hypothetical protein
MVAAAGDGRGLPRDSLSRAKTARLMIVRGNVADSTPKSVSRKWPESFEAFGLG